MTSRAMGDKKRKRYEIPRVLFVAYRSDGDGGCFAKLIDEETPRPLRMGGKRPSRVARYLLAPSKGKRRGR